MAQSIFLRWSQLVQRPTPAGDFLPVIDGLRFIAIMSVILYHLNDYLITKTGRHGEADWLSGLLAHGHIGVPLFFALSGFIIARPFLAGTAPPLMHYFVRRLTRLEPPYLINLLLIYALLITVLGLDAQELFPHLIASAVYLHHLVFGGASKVNFVAWSLEIEFQFYLLAPILLAGLGTAGPLTRRIALTAIVLIGGWIHHVPEVTQSVWGLTLLRYCGFFAAGMLAADVFVTSWKQCPEPCHAGDVAALLGWLGVGAGLSASLSVTGLLPAAMFLILLGSLSSRHIARILSARPIYLVGGMCYTLYLYHFYIISATGRLLLPLMDNQKALSINILIAGVCILPIIIIFCLILFVFIEKPLMNKKNSTNLFIKISECNTQRE